MNLIKDNVARMRWIRIIPVLVFASFIQNIDKSIISFALPGGMAKEEVYLDFLEQLSE